MEEKQKRCNRLFCQLMIQLGKKLSVSFQLSVR